MDIRTHEIKRVCIAVSRSMAPRSARASGNQMTAIRWLFVGKAFAARERGAGAVERRCVGRGLFLFHWRGSQ